MLFAKGSFPEDRHLVISSRWRYDVIGPPSTGFIDGWVLTRDEYNALPDGFRVIDRMGNQHIKKGPTTGIGSVAYGRELSLYCAASEFEYMMVLGIAGNE